ncbi:MULTISPECIES: hypothetical protein [Rhizobium]|uniref:ABC transporter permease n=1 Tax=Rhizobium rhododendri TaxID=2506430 RepID=A0ABY8IFV2_9HYPH|nr:MULTISPECIES: hypothetical protein [Rhizobium]MBO9100288.1 hypothetical protein [Rhizobium sp. L58/93]MBO9135554.1 hypothetical protein [Rhizobium sp. B209b/85]MBO9170254.1 hypothetical protein [Rhizobium sp. L245/93]MBO9186181.1 hypothetical protein [Rhizobium sp. E27B/91]MBZ5760683.1 hypothetical protein [Rhizobium sp. VS19-DR96]
MANIGLSNASVDELGPSSERRRLAVTAGISKRRRWETVLHVVLFAAAFAFVAAMVCGVGT